MKTLVTGASGMLGSHLVEHLVAQHHEVRAFVRKTSDISHLKTTGAEIISGDVGDYDSLLPAVKGVDVVFHAAARVMPGWGSWQEFEASIVKGTENVLRASAEAGVSRFLQVSSGSVYGQACCRGMPASESTPCELAFKPESYYDCAKLQAEKAAFDYQKEGKLQVSAIRPGWVYGPRDRLLTDRLTRQLQMPIVVWPGKANPRIPLVFASDVANCAILAATSDRAVGQVYNVAPLHEIRLRDFAVAMARALGRPEPKVFIPYGLAYAVCALSEAWSRLRRVKEIPYLTRSGLQHLNTEMLLDASKARKELGWEPKVSVSEGIRLWVQWQRSKEQK
jgi:nucleoside-diphosphate-sugar epimerase